MILLTGANENGFTRLVIVSNIGLPAGMRAVVLELSVNGIVMVAVVPLKHERVAASIVVVLEQVNVAGMVIVVGN